MDVAGIIIGLVIGAIAMGYIENNAMKNEAIEAGVAHYVCDDRGDCEFEYKTVKE